MTLIDPETLHRIDELERRTNGDHPTVDVGPSTWERVDLTDALTGTDIPPPTILARSDGVCLLYPGRTHWFQGEPESCKTWAALVAAAQTLVASGSVLWIDFEDDDRGIVSRLRAISVPDEAIRERFVYVRPDEPLYDTRGRPLAGADALAILLERHTFTLSVIDGVSEAMQTEGLDPMSNPDIAQWVRRLPRRIADSGPATACLDHVVKDKEGRGRYAIGGQHKLAGVTGAVYRFDTVTPLSRALGTEPTTGTVAVSVMKDRPGYVRGRALGERVATMDLTSYPDGGLTVALLPPGHAPTPDLALCKRIADYLEQYDGATKNAIINDVEGKTDRIREAIAWMLADDRVWIRIERSGQSHRHYLTDVGKDYFG